MNAPTGQQVRDAVETLARDLFSRGAGSIVFDHLVGLRILVTRDPEVMGAIEDGTLPLGQMRKVTKVESGNGGVN